MLTSLGLANYSEFGLIVGSVCASQGWLDAQWLVILAIALSLTFFAAAPVNAFSSAIYARWVGSIVRTQRVTEASKIEPIEIGTAHIVIIGMSGFGTAAYDALPRTYGEVPVGVDLCSDVVEDHRKQGRNVFDGDTDDSGFWDRIGLSHSNVDLVMRALPDLKTNENKGSSLLLTYSNSKCVKGRLDIHIKVKAKPERFMGDAVPQTPWGLPL